MYPCQLSLLVREQLPKLLARIDADVRHGRSVARSKLRIELDDWPIRITVETAERRQTLEYRELIAPSLVVRCSTIRRQGSILVKHGVNGSRSSHNGLKVLGSLLNYAAIFG